MFDETTTALLAKEMYIVQETIRPARNLRAEANVAPQVVVPHLAFDPTDETAAR